MKLVLFGFFRNAIDEIVPHAPLSKNEKYIFAPSLKHELESDTISVESIHTTFSNVEQAVVYDYNAIVPKHDTYVQKMEHDFGLPPFIGPKQKPHRTLSFFYNIRESLKLLPLDVLDDDEPVVLARADSNINHVCEQTITQLLESHDVICTGYRGGTNKFDPQPSLPGGGKSVIDHVFVMKKAAINCFIDLYDDVEMYLRNRYLPKNPKGRCVNPKTLPDDVLISTIPETLFWYHFHMKGIKPIVDPTPHPKLRAVHYTFQAHKNKQQFLNKIISQ